MALPHAQSGDVVDIRPYGQPLIDGAQSFALFKARQLEVMRLVLPAGHEMPSHRVDGEITLQCLEGLVQIDVEGRKRALAAGELMYVAGGLMHALKTEQASSVLVTIAL